MQTRRKVVIPISLLEKVEKLGIIPNNGKLSENQVFELYESTRSKSVPKDIGQWVDLALRKLDVNPASYAAFIDILAFPYGGHKDGKDCAGEFFHPGTDFMDQHLPYPPVIMSHGYDTDGTGDSQKTIVAEALRREYDDAGGWLKLGIIPNTPYTEEILDAWSKGVLMASSTAILRQYDSVIDGKIDTWLAGEVSLLTPKSGMEPCNFLASAGSQKSETEILELVERQEEPHRTRLKDLLDSVKKREQDVLVSDDQNPTSPFDKVDDNSEEIAGLNTEDEEIDMGAFKDDQKTELQEMVTESVTAASDGIVAKILAQLKPATTAPATPETEANPEKDNRSKGDISAFLAAKKTSVQTAGVANKGASDLVDSYIEAGKINPESRQDAITAVSAAIETDQRSKSGTKALEAITNLLDAGLAVPLTSSSMLGGFGASKGKSEADSVDDADVAAMERAAGIAN